MCNNETGIEANPSNGFPVKAVLNWRNEVVVTRGGLERRGEGRGKVERKETKNRWNDGIGEWRE